MASHGRPPVRTASALLSPQQIIERTLGSATPAASRKAIGGAANECSVRGEYVVTQLPPPRLKDPQWTATPAAGR